MWCPKSVALNRVCKKKISSREQNASNFFLEHQVGSVLTIANTVRDCKQSSTTVDPKKFKKNLGSDWMFSGTEDSLEPDKGLMGIEKEFYALKVPWEKNIRLA